MSLTKNRLINSAAHITGGGLVENLRRSIPGNLSINIDLSKIKVTNIFKWLKKNQISESEMLTTFNCGVGFCIIVDKKNINKIKRKFSKKYRPYEIGYVSKESNKDNLFNKIKW
jgi:phosphoribosylformylglycinamidine cyclo-ligase